MSLKENGPTDVEVHKNLALKINGLQIETLSGFREGAVLHENNSYSLLTCT